VFAAPDRRCACVGQKPRVCIGRALARCYCRTMDDIRRAAPKAKVLNRDRARFEVAGGSYRLIASFDFRRQIVFVKFIGTHAEYDAIDALTVARF
jgi:mRNA-degrading endonuclease HigB of HigAB toxin-antitoxin module